ncbi:hypothetical protein EYF80_008936 [Liparis tanakae]|uniref:Uncharacterized protein n=1 Tax=Liparis tanakae TaxID=230148 RepID=A0A4Z2ISX1_9TELE|nr:hypothetical protein EYF80_008936 [Liparis tanakae]
MDCGVVGAVEVGEECWGEGGGRKGPRGAADTCCSPGGAKEQQIIETLTSMPCLTVSACEAERKTWGGGIEALQWAYYSAPGAVPGPGYLGHVQKSYTQLLMQTLLTGDQTQLQSQTGPFLHASGWITVAPLKQSIVRLFQAMMESVSGMASKNSLPIAVSSSIPLSQRGWLSPTSADILIWSQFPLSLFTSSSSSGTWPSCAQAFHVWYLEEKATMRDAKMARGSRTSWITLTSRRGSSTRGCNVSS